MLRYLIRRILYTIPIVLGVAGIVFFLFHVVGGDPTYLMVGKRASPEMIEMIRKQYGFDQPLWMQFIHYLYQIVTFNFGRSYDTHRLISEMILRGIGPSTSLAVMGFCMTFFFSITIALVVSFFRATWIDRVVVVLCVVGMSVSALVYILVGQYVFAYQWGVFPVSGYEFGFFERFQYLFLPALIWLFVSLGVDVRFFRTAILDETQQDYVRTARSKGLSEPFIYFKHILKNSAVPILTYTVIQIPFLILGAFLLETFFLIPGIGRMTIDALNASDFPVLKAMTTLFALLMVAGNLLTDIFYVLVDPRIELK